LCELIVGGLTAQVASLPEPESPAAVATRGLPREGVLSSMDRAKLDVDTLLKIVLVLIVVWLVLEIIGGVLGLLGWLLGPLQPILGVVLVVLIVLWLLDRL
jgi:hypothetical protein